MSSGSICAAGFGSAFCGTGGAVLKALSLCGGIGGKTSENFGAVVAEIEIELEIGGEGNQGNQIGHLHVLVHVFFGGIDGPIDLFGLHRGKIEEEQHQAAVAHVLGGLGIGREDWSNGGGSGRAGDGGIRGAGKLGVVHIFEVEAGNLLFFVVLEYGEIFFLEVAHRIALFISHDNVDENHFGGHAHAN